LLTDEQIEEVLQRGGREAGINFPHEIKQSIVGVSRGVPYIAQLLGLHAGIEALARRSADVDMADFEAACARALDEMDPRVAALYGRLVGRYAEANMRLALLAVASSREQDRFGRFTAMPAKGGWLVAGQHLTTEQWTLMLEMAAVRECPSAGYGVFAFADAMLQHYVLLEAVLSAGPRQAAAPDPRRGSIEAWNADPQLVPGTGTHG
jgi:hypothetical protein